MELKELTLAELYSEFPQSMTPYGSETFNKLNAPKAGRLAALGMVDSKGKARLGVLLGLVEGSWRLPFSAPFGEVLYRRPQTLETCMEFARLLAGWGGTTGLRVTLAPDFYDPEMLPRLKGAFATVARESYTDYNYSYPLRRYADFRSGLSGNARNHLNRAEKAGFEFEADAECRRVYEVIRINRAEHSYPLAMSFEALEVTAKIVDIDWHLLRLGEADVAAAVVYRLNSSVAQVIYWGDVSGYSSERPMNLLAACVCDHYRRAGFEVLDIGPSSSAGRPDVGLCTFKESLGCDLTFKPTFLVGCAAAEV